MVETVGSTDQAQRDEYAARWWATQRRQAPDWMRPAVIVRAEQPDERIERLKALVRND